MTERDTVRCSVQSHALRERRFQWDQLSSGDWEARAYCLLHDEPELISAIDIAKYAPLLPPKPPVTRTLI